jgi:putative endonuclease
MKEYYVYIFASEQNGTLYIGVTSDLLKRVGEHRSHDTKGFTQKYSVDKLVYFEKTESVEAAIYREKQLKHWNRAWKLELIEQSNLGWNDLSDDF